MFDEIAFLIDCDNAYHNGEELLISDYDYDRLKTEARALYPDDPYFKTVGASPAGSKVDLPYVLGSLEKMKFDGTMKQWLIESNAKEIACSDKLDGCTILARYNNGKVEFASTRGNGYQGHDITEKARIFLPEASHQGVITLKGEVLATYQTARDLGYKKARTFVAGCLNRDDMTHAETLQVVFYQVLDSSFDTFVDHISFIKSIGLPVVPYTVLKLDEFVQSDYENILADLYRERKGESIFDIDGLVIVDNSNANHQDDFYPSSACAFKVNEDAVITTVTSVEWEVKRSGKIQPVVHIEPIDISGSEVTKATGFNYKFIVDNKIGEGSEIGIVLSGEIIPYITDVFKEGVCTVPCVCPSCGSDVLTTSSGVDLQCINNDCKGRMVYVLENFLIANGVEEISATTIRNLGWSSFDDVLDVNEFDISMTEGFGASRASTIVNQINKIYNTSPANLLRSFGITGLGKTMSAELIHHFGSIESIFDAEINDFKVIPGIGDVMAERLYNELGDYMALYDELVKRGLTFKKASGDSMKGKKVTLTGASEIKRNDLIKMIEEQGGMVKGISKGVDYLFTNSPESTTSKMKKAKEYGTVIFGYEKLYEMLGVSV